MCGADPAKVRGDLDELSSVGVEFSRRHMDFLGRCHGGFQHGLAGFLVRYLQPGQIGKQGRRGIARVESEASAVVECPTVAAQMRNMVAATVV